MVAHGLLSCKLISKVSRHLRADGHFDFLNLTILFVKDVEKAMAQSSMKDAWKIKRGFNTHTGRERDSRNLPWV